MGDSFPRHLDPLWTVHFCKVKYFSAPFSLPVDLLQRFRRGKALPIWSFFADRQILQVSKEETGPSNALEACRRPWVKLCASDGAEAVFPKTQVSFWWKNSALGM